MVQMFCRSQGARVTVLIGAVLVLGACGTGNPSSPKPNSSTTTPSSVALSPGKSSSSGAAAVAAYGGMWDDYVAAAATSDWQSPKLGQHATGLALSTLTRGLDADHYNGLVSRGSPTHDVTVIALAPTSAPETVTVTDCSDSTGALKYRADNGQLANDSPGGRRLINATVQKQSDGSWKVSDFGVHGVGTC